jgi:hypothetical protein
MLVHLGFNRPFERTLMRPERPTVKALYQDRDGVRYMVREVEDISIFGLGDGYVVTIADEQQLRQEERGERLLDVQFETFYREKGLVLLTTPTETP